MTTNGYRLKERAREWFDAGLTALNVSVDSLDPRQFHPDHRREQTGGGDGGDRRRPEPPVSVGQDQRGLLRGSMIIQLGCLPRLDPGQTHRTSFHRTDADR